jgi:hypothetical protein
VASRKKETQIQDLADTFANMRRAHLRLNPEKCVFSVQRGRVLGCLVSVKGIEANLDKRNAIIHMKPPRSRKEVQRLTGRIVALNRFMAKLAEQSLPFLKNTEADELAKATARKVVLPPDVFFQLIEDSSIKIVEQEPRMVNVEQGEDW